jgi:hypothetical protein
MTGLLAPLTRPELDALINEATRAEMVAHIALVNAPLEPDRVYDAAGVSVDCLEMLRLAQEESLGRFLDGEELRRDVFGRSDADVVREEKAGDDGA